MGLCDELSSTAARYLDGKISFDGEYYQGIFVHQSWPPASNHRGRQMYLLGSEPHPLVPFFECTDFTLNVLQRNRVLSHPVAIVHPERIDDCRDEVLYAALLHLTLLPKTTGWSLAIPSEYATAVNGNHLSLLRKPRREFHPPQYRVGGEFYRFPHPLPVVPNENALETIIMAQRLPELRVIQ